MPSKHNVAVTFTGDVFSLFVELEGHEIQLMNNGAGTWSRTLIDFEIDPGLNVHCVAKGFAGTDCKLSVVIDGGKAEVFEGKIPGAKPFLIDREINL